MGRIIVESADNGFLLNYPFYYDDGTRETRSIVFEYKDSEDTKSECEAVQKLFYEMMEHIGYCPSKHKKYNVRIIVDGPNGEE